MLRQIFENYFCVYKNVRMRKITQTTAIFILFFCWCIVNLPVRALDNPEPSGVSQQKTAITVSSEASDEDMFAPIELDLTDYTQDE